jgi:hypothetical protein
MNGMCDVYVRVLADNLIDVMTMDEHGHKSWAKGRSYWHSDQLSAMGTNCFHSSATLNYRIVYVVLTCRTMGCLIYYDITVDTDYVRDTNMSDMVMCMVVSTAMLMGAICTTALIACRI